MLWTANRTQLWSRSFPGLLCDLGRSIYDRIWSLSHTDHTGHHGHSQPIFSQTGQGVGRVNRGSRAGIGLQLGETAGLDSRFVSFLADRLCAQIVEAFGAPASHVSKRSWQRRKEYFWASHFPQEPLFVDHCFFQRNVISLSNLRKVRLHWEVIWTLSHVFLLLKSSYISEINDWQKDFQIEVLLDLL